MMSSRDHSKPAPGSRPVRPVGEGRLNLLLSAAGPVAWRDEGWAESLPRLLEPMGVRSWRVRSGREATAVLRDVPMHIALVDLSLPLDDPSATSGASGMEEGGARLLELLARLETPPPTIVVKRRRGHREDVREVCRALRAGVFAVLERPVHIETTLEVMRRVLARHYGGGWPACDPPGELN